MSFEAVFVCTGNRFRSPIADAVLRREVGDLPVHVHSLGTLDLGVVPALPEAVAEGARLRLDLAAHRARPVLGADLAAADLVVGFERMHVVTAVVDAAARIEHTYTLPELVELLEQLDQQAGLDPLERARWAIDRAAALRPRDPRTDSLPELADPLGGTPTVFRSTADRVHDLTVRLAAGLFGQSVR